MEHQQLACQIIDCGKNSYKTIYEGFCPITKNSILNWIGFSDEGMLLSRDDLGVISMFSFKSKQWIPVLDLKKKFDNSYKSIWIVGFMEHELMYIELPRGADQPPDQMRSRYKTMPLSVPFIVKESDDIVIGEENRNDDNQSLAELEEEFFRKKLIMEHETFRNDTWLSYKLFRGHNDNERFQSENILDTPALNQKRKD